ncbi:Tm-1-like ATP-binding domain-containing protein [Candidatus Sumerlaeota bacterium]|nr:Tm-1-like ATP-binding domain-containing protein [Candidatus Sumerlaeota bacterium]
MATIAILGTLDTKGAEFAFLKEQIEKHGHKTLTIDLGILSPPPFEPDVPRAEIAQAAGTEIETLAESNDRGRAVAAMTAGAAAIVPSLYAEKKFDAIIGMGGSGGTAMSTAAMRALPLGVPKVMISTVAGGDVKTYVGVKDIVMIPSIVDVAGLNRILRGVIERGAAAVCAMADAAADESRRNARTNATEKPLICASMFGNTTACVEAARAKLEAAGYEVLVFHATGAGGQTMESLIEAGYIAGVFDATTTEWADELVGGVLAAGPKRMEAAARSGTPAVLAPGCLDMVNFWAPETIPSKFKGRLFYPHNPNVTLMRTTPEECAELGRIFAEKANLSTGPVAVYLPLGGISVISKPGGPFFSPPADAALFAAIKKNLRKDIPVHEFKEDINDPAFASAMAEGLIILLR